MQWHDNADTRKKYGDELEDLFVQSTRCSCGGQFEFIGDKKAGWPDFTCDNCGQLVDVKSSPQAEQTGNIAVSATPWKNYPEDLLLVTRIKGDWIGEYKKFIRTLNDQPFSPTHNSRPTRFFLISWKQFRKLEALGFAINISESFS